MTDATIATVNDYDGLIAALRDRAAAIGYTNDTLDAVTGLPAGYIGKLLGPGLVKKLGPLSFGVLMQALGLRVVLVEDPETMAKVGKLGLIRERGPVTPNRISMAALERYIPVLSREFARRGGKASALKRMGNSKEAKRMRRRVAKTAANARWAKDRRHSKKKKRPVDSEVSLAQKDHGAE